MLQLDINRIMKNDKQHLFNAIVRTKKRNAYHFKKIQTLGFNFTRIETKVSFKDSKETLAKLWIELANENLRFNKILIDYNL